MADIADARVAATLVTALELAQETWQHFDGAFAGIVVA